MEKRATLLRRFSMAVFGLPLVLLVVGCPKSSHTYQASCDGRGPQKVCEDYYHDYRGEASCTEPVKLIHTPCDRTNVIGGCRERGLITWFYVGSTDTQATAKKCSFDHQWVAADWKEQETK
jgi:hypothetical protein